MTTKSLKKSQGKSATPATGAGQSTKLTTKATSSSHTLKVLNDRVLVLADKEETVEGASKEVMSAIESGTLELPDSYRAAYFKRPTWGTIISWGDRCKYQWHQGQRVSFPRDGWAKLSYEGVEYLVFAESQLNATLL